VPEKKNNFLICPFKKILKKWNSILTILRLHFEFEQYRQRKMALGTNGLRLTRIRSQNFIYRLELQLLLKGSVPCSYGSGAMFKILKVEANQRRTTERQNDPER
jgi:hypothetical protein